MKKDIPLAVDTGRGFSINYKGKNLYSKYNPAKTPEKIAESTLLKKETLYIIPSPLLMYGIDRLLEKLPESSCILGLEIDQMLMKLTVENNCYKNSDSFLTVRLDSREQLKAVIEELGIWRFRRCDIIPLNSGYNLFKEQYDYLFNFSSFLLSTFWRNRLTINKLSRLWIKNILTNLKSPSFCKPDNAGKPVVVCGAGPSLEESLSLIKSKRDKLYIMAVDTALSPLLKSGITPDIVFALESQFYNLGDFYNSRGLNIDLLTDISGYPPVCRNMNGRTYFFSSQFFENKLLNRISSKNKIAITIPPLGSVGVAAVYTALKLFDSHLFLTGLDFSFIPGKSHSKGSPFSNTMLRTSDRIHPAGSYHIAMNRQLLERPGKKAGSTILTDHVLESYARLLTDIISQENRVYDLSKTGYPLGAEPVDSNIIESLLETKHSKTDFLFCSPNKQFNYTAFYEYEMALLKKLIAEWNNFNSSNLKEIPDCLIEALKEVDYTYIDFPDRLPHPIREVSFISRAVRSAREYMKLLDKLSE